MIVLWLFILLYIKLTYRVSETTLCIACPPPRKGESNSQRVLSVAEEATKISHLENLLGIYMIVLRLFILIIYIVRVQRTRTPALHLICRARPPPKGGKVSPCENFLSLKKRPCLIHKKLFRLFKIYDLIGLFISFNFDLPTRPGQPERVSLMKPFYGDAIL